MIKKNRNKNQNSNQIQSKKEQAKNEKLDSQNEIFATIRVMNGNQVLKKKVITRKSLIKCDSNEK